MIYEGCMERGQKITISSFRGCRNETFSWIAPITTLVFGTAKMFQDIYLGKIHKSFSTPKTTAAAGLKRCQFLMVF